jgi:DNA-binding transcriptional regulator YhcF (GntR family)
VHARPANAGRVYPSYDRLAAATALGRATVARALQILEDAASSSASVASGG